LKLPLTLFLLAPLVACGCTSLPASDAFDMAIMASASESMVPRVAECLDECYADLEPETRTQFLASLANISRIASASEDQLQAGANLLLEFATFHDDCITGCLDLDPEAQALALEQSALFREALERLIL